MIFSYNLSASSLSVYVIFLSLWINRIPSSTMPIIFVSYPAISFLYASLFSAHVNLNIYRNIRVESSLYVPQHSRPLQIYNLRKLLQVLSYCEILVSNIYGEYLWRIFLVNILAEYCCRTFRKNDQKNIPVRFHSCK